MASSPTCWVALQRIHALIRRPRLNYRQQALGARVGTPRIHRNDELQ